MEYWSPEPTAYGGTRCNFWGYSTVNFFSPMARYAANPLDGRSVCREARARRTPTDTQSHAPPVSPSSATTSR